MELDDLATGYDRPRIAMRKKLTPIIQITDPATV